MGIYLGSGLSVRLARWSGAWIDTECRLGEVGWG